MAGSTPNLGLYLPGGGSTGTWTPDEVADIDPLNQNFQKIDTYAGTVGVQANRNQQFYGPAGAIASVSGMKLGDEYQESDGSKIRWRYDGTAWVVSVESGMTLIRPATFAGCTIAADGSIIPTATPAEITLDGVFTTKFRSYRLVFQVRNSVSAGMLISLRRAGANVGATGYGYSRISVSTTGTVTGSGNTTAAAWDLVTSGGTYVAGELTILNPAFAGVKTAVGTIVALSTGNVTSNFGGGNGDATITAALDGIKIAPTSGTFLIDSSQSHFKLYGLA